ncbi:MAG TPA: hypothetical protein DCL61_11350 [Cyanobacteria bacterium UBA12227]|nr:hypothetical protein [Cyanobacteria bacterium UBA12227]HAX89672.1 hypothetical protein [Cyanobacteria bacterium UBA11370]HBY79173.1 hypothetical protein [Cyanobacteria bacterium UBA11148]
MCKNAEVKSERYWEFSVNPGDYLYVLAWDGGLVQSWIGEFKLPDGSSLLSNLSDWEYTIASGNNPGYGGPLPPLATVAADIAGATWASPQASVPQGTSPWFTIPGISSSAQFIWHDTLASDSTSDNHYVIFRTKNPAVPSTSENIPEPSSAVGLVVISALGAASILKKKLTSSRKV